MSEYREITPECRANRGDYPAYDQAVHDLWHVYGVMLHRHPDATFVLTLARKPDTTASAQAGGQAEPVDTCRPVEIDGETIRVRGAAEMSDESRAALAEVIALVREAGPAAVSAVVSPPTSRAAYAQGLLAAADFVRGLLLTRTLVTTTSLEAELRRLAAEAQQQPDTEAHPPLHAWRVETRDGEWAPGSHFLNRQAAVKRYETANRTAPLWQDGTPVERRIVRETTTYTVEQPAAADDEETLCRCGHGRAYHDAKYVDPQCRLCPEDGERSWRHPFTPADVPRP